MIAALCVVSAHPSRAALVPVDVLAPHDGLATLDTETELAWLDLTPTIGLSPNAVLAGAGGWVASGWRYATPQEACSLFARYLFAWQPCPSISLHAARRPDEVAQFLDLFGVTFSFESLQSAYGFIAGSDAPQFGDAIVMNAEAAIAIEAVTTGEVFGVADNLFPTGEYALSDFGSFLVRPIPEPSTAVMLAIGLAVLSARRGRI